MRKVCFAFLRNEHLGFAPRSIAQKQDRYQTYEYAFLIRRWFQ